MHCLELADEWHDTEPQDLIPVSLCIQIAIDKCNCVCCPLLMPANTITPVHNIDMSKPLAHMTPYTLCNLPSTVETGIHP